MSLRQRAFPGRRREPPRPPVPTQKIAPEAPTPTLKGCQYALAILPPTPEEHVEDEERDAPEHSLHQATDVEECHHVEQQVRRRPACRNIAVSRRHQLAARDERVVGAAPSKQRFHASGDIGETPVTTIATNTRTLMARSTGITRGGAVWANRRANRPGVLFQMGSRFQGNVELQVALRYRLSSRGIGRWWRNTFIGRTLREGMPAVCAGARPREVILPATAAAHRCAALLTTGSGKREETLWRRIANHFVIDPPGECRPMRRA